MSEKLTPQNADSNEIDIFEFINRIGAALKKFTNSIGRALLIAFVFLIRKWIPVSLTIAAAFVISYIFTVLAPTFYTSDMVMRNNAVPNEQMIAYINRLKESGNKTEMLNISQSTNNNINKIEAFWIIDFNKDTIPDRVDYSNSHNLYDTVNVRMNDRFDIQLQINSTQELSSVRDGLISYINSNMFFQELNKVRLNQLSERIRRMDIDLNRIDSLQKVKFFEETRNKTTQQLILNQPSNETQLLYKDIYAIIKKKQELETELSMYNQIVTVLNDFTVPLERTNNIFYYAKTVLPCLLILVILILIVISKRTALNRIFEKY